MGNKNYIYDDNWKIHVWVQTPIIEMSYSEYTAYTNFIITLLWGFKLFKITRVFDFTLPYFCTVHFFFLYYISLLWKYHFILIQTIISAI